MKSRIRRPKSARCANLANVRAGKKGVEDEIRAWEFLEYWGWESVRGSGLVNYYYVSPSLQTSKKETPRSSYTQLGKHKTDFFYSIAEVLDFVQSEGCHVVEGKNTTQEFLAYKNNPAGYKEGRSL